MLIYSKPDCPYCVKAKELLDSRGIFYEEKIVGVDISSEEYKDLIPGHTTVPGIYIDGCFLGGYTQLVSYFRYKS
jgi:glutaredoxin